VIVQACLNGARPVGFHPRLPVTPAQIVADGLQAVRAGAAELHVHVRNDEGVETLAPAAVDAVVGGLREKLPGTLVGISTGAWIEKDDARRLAAIDGWRALPDYASVNLSETGAPAVFAKLRSRGVAVEAGLGSVADAERFIAEGLARECLRILIELDDGQQGSKAAHEITDGILVALAGADIRKPILIHGAGETVWSFVERAARERYSTRVGLEDGSTLPDGRTAASNGDLVSAAVAIMRQH
jgi:uncharacterized protein (DUF849 family)